MANEESMRCKFEKGGGNVHVPQSVYVEGNSGAECFKRPSSSPPDEGVETPQRDVTPVAGEHKSDGCCLYEKHSELIPTSFMSSEIRGVFCLNAHAAARRG